MSLFTYIQPCNNLRSTYLCNLIVIQRKDISIKGKNLGKVIFLRNIREKGGAIYFPWKELTLMTSTKFILTNLIHACNVNNVEKLEVGPYSIFSALLRKSSCSLVNISIPLLSQSNSETLPILRIFFRVAGRCEIKLKTFRYKMCSYQG